MAKFSIIFLLCAILIFIVDIHAQDRECTKNEEYNSCGSACPPSCNDDPSRICTLQCIPSCQCKQGYLRNAQDNCVTPTEC